MLAPDRERHERIAGRHVHERLRSRHEVQRHNISIWYSLTATKLQRHTRVT
jgi:hypothetical protein